MMCANNLGYKSRLRAHYEERLRGHSYSFDRDYSVLLFSVKQHSNTNYVAKYVNMLEDEQQQRKASLELSRGYGD